MDNLSQSKSFDSDKDGKSFKESFQNSSNAVLLDVRTPEEYLSGTLEGAINMDYYAPDFESKITSLDKDKEYFVFCRSGNRSGKTCNLLVNNGVNSFNLQGGIGEWPDDL